MHRYVTNSIMYALVLFILKFCFQFYLLFASQCIIGSIKINIFTFVALLKHDFQKVLLPSNIQFLNIKSTF